MVLNEIDIFEMEESLWVANKPVGVSAYDFKFEPLFRCRRPYAPSVGSELICRIGAIENYKKSYEIFKENGFSLVNSVEEHERASELSCWYPLIEFCTPRSKWYEEVPSIYDIENDFNYPIFIKGSRQTAKHSESLSVARNRDECLAILKEYQLNPILHWQQLVCREFVELEPVKSVKSEKVSTSFEFRSFWYKGRIVGVGHYWSEFVQYGWSASQEAEALKLAATVSSKVSVPFLVIDLALTKDGSWIVIECNDGQESGYAGIKPIVLWKNIVEIERSNA